LQPYFEYRAAIHNRFKYGCHNPKWKWVLTQEGEVDLSNNIEALLREIVKEYVDKDIPVENLDAGIEIEKFGIDSFNYVRIVAAVETKFNIEFGDEELLNGAFKTLGEMVEYIGKMVTEG
jgi:acyl carrier protein